MDKSVYQASVTLLFYVRASDEKSAAQLVHGLLISRGEHLAGHTVALEMLNMERSPDGQTIEPWDGELDAEEADEKPPQCS